MSSSLWRVSSLSGHVAELGQGGGGNSTGWEVSNAVGKGIQSVGTLQAVGE